MKRAKKARSIYDEWTDEDWTEYFAYLYGRQDEILNDVTKAIKEAEKKA